MKVKGMVFCPHGSYKKVILQNGDSIQEDITVSPFWISNEITNKEYREFYDHVNRTPNDTIYWFDFEKLNSESKFLTRENITSYLNTKLHSEISPELIDNSVWNSTPDKMDYFSNPKYNDYPVVGVPYKGAMFYCIWRTTQENKKLESQGEPLITDYRLPLEIEWEYVATFNNQNNPGGKNNLHKTKKGEKNELGVYNLCGNVSEWTSSTEVYDNNEVKVVRGGSWKLKADITLKEIMNPDKATNYIGFRIVRSYPTFY